MVIFTFVVCSEPYKFEAIDTSINLDDSTRNLPDRLDKFCSKHNAKLAACSTWISFTGIQSQEFIEGACREGLGGLSDLIARSDRVIFFGPGG